GCALAVQCPNRPGSGHAPEAACADRWKERWRALIPVRAAVGRFDRAPFLHHLCTNKGRRPSQTPPFWAVYHPGCRGLCMIVVVGLEFEARIAIGPGTRVICGGDGRNLAADLTRAITADCGRLLSFGVAGGLAPELRPGDCVVGTSVLSDQGRI